MGAALALALRLMLRLMSPLSENTAIVVLGLIATTTALAAHVGGSPPLAALLAGVLLKHFYPAPGPGRGRPARPPRCWRF